jgi:hypothetical protein
MCKVPISSLPEPFVNAAEAGKFLRLHPVTIQRLARKGVLPGHPVNGNARKHWRFLLSELGAWLRERCGDNCEGGLEP